MSEQFEIRNVKPIEFCEINKKKLSKNKNRYTTEVTKTNFAWKLLQNNLEKGKKVNELLFYIAVYSESLCNELQYI